MVAKRAGQADFIRILEWEDKHYIGDTECNKCCSLYPEPCKCGGLVHADFTYKARDDWDGYDMTKICDKGCANPREVA